MLRRALVVLAFMSGHAFAQSACVQAGDMTYCNGVWQQTPQQQQPQQTSAPPMAGSQQGQEDAIQVRQQQLAIRQRLTQQEAQHQQPGAPQQDAYLQQKANQAQLQRDARLRGIQAQLIQATPETRPVLLGQMSQIDPNMALQYRQMFAIQQTLHTASSAPSMQPPAQTVGNPAVFAGMATPLSAHSASTQNDSSSARKPAVRPLSPNQVTPN
ncbi:MAG TPA: hypothetical protein VK660_00210 [Xanthomonadaceae bacterium]|jgi:hypothetical protein|nr:hypothetical protein [Xanthomonadaceae bacterium]